MIDMVMFAIKQILCSLLRLPKAKTITQSAHQCQNFLLTKNRLYWTNDTITKEYRLLAEIVSCLQELLELGDPAHYPVVRKLAKTKKKQLIIINKISGDSK